MHSQFVNGDTTFAAEPKPSLATDVIYSCKVETTRTVDDFQGFEADNNSEVRSEATKTINHLLTPLMLLKRLPILDLCIQLIKNGLLLF
jgi:hypothetical protein